MRTAIQILRDIRDMSDNIEDLQAIVNGDVFYDAILHLDELINAASDDNISFTRQSGVQYINPHKGERARARLKAALAKVQGEQA